ncbi:Cupin domain protein [Aspergillus sclerotialis]|uniref:Cupin domain protein n=1 Tax=Aspergillus sclerotialis TaxID=2070753 RepID=A0A3A2ZJ31_9EURO|nr:Cupin domain protein [Aspergillus sclerotialis]
MTDTPQLSNLRPLTRHITTHNNSGKAAIHSSDTLKWQAYDDNKMAFSTIYTTSTTPPDLTNNADIPAHEKTMSDGHGLVNPNGSVIRCVDLAPGYVCIMHRTKSLDYGIVLEGQVDLILDSGEARKMGRGDVAVQRATMHQWRNSSAENWARMMFVLQDCMVGDENGGEDLGMGIKGLNSSGKSKF